MHVRVKVTHGGFSQMLCMIHRDLQIFLVSRGRFLCPGAVFVVAMMSGAAPAGIATGRGVLAATMSKL